MKTSRVLIRLERYVISQSHAMAGRESWWAPLPASFFLPRVLPSLAPRSLCKIRRFSSVLFNSRCPEQLDCRSKPGGLRPNGTLDSQTSFGTRPSGVW